MRIWGAFLKPNQPYILPLKVDGFRKSLRITQASLEHNYGASCTVRCVVGTNDPIYICKLSPTQDWSCKLDLRFDGSQDVVLISDRDVHLGGHFISPGYMDGIIVMDRNSTDIDGTKSDLDIKSDNCAMHSFEDRSNMNQSEDVGLVVNDSEDEGVTGKEQKRVKEIEGLKGLFRNPVCELWNSKKQSDENPGFDEENRSLHTVAGIKCTRSHKNLKKRKKTVKIMENQNSDMADNMHEKDKYVEKRKKGIATEKTTIGGHEKELRLAEESTDHHSKGPLEVISKIRSLYPITEIDHAENHSLLKNEKKKATENMKISDSDMANGMHPEKVDIGTKKIRRHEQDKYIKKRNKGIATAETIVGGHGRELCLAEESNDHGSKGLLEIICKNRSLHPIADIDCRENHSLLKNEPNKAVENMKIYDADMAGEFHVENDSVGRKVDNFNKEINRYIVRQRKKDDTNGKTTPGAFGY